MKLFFKSNHFNLEWPFQDHFHRRFQARHQQSKYTILALNIVSWSHHRHIVLHNTDKDETQRQ